jgi:hypothetical protein
LIKQQTMHYLSFRCGQWCQPHQVKWRTGIRGGSHTRWCSYGAQWSDQSGTESDRTRESCY